MSNTVKQKRLFTFFLVIACIWIFLEYEDWKFFAQNVLKLDFTSVYLSVSVKERYTVAWTDYHEEYLIETSPEFLQKMIEAKPYIKNISELEKINSTLFSNLGTQNSFTISEFYSFGDWQSKGGSTRIFVNSEHTKAVIFYDAD